MSSIREWAIMLCTVSAASAFIVFLIPSGNLKKSANIVISLFLLSVVVLPVFGDDTFDIEISDFSMEDFPDEEDYKLDYEEFVIESGKSLVEQQVTDILNDVCTEDFSVQVDMANDADGNTVLSDIHISVSASDSTVIGIIETEVGKLTGLVPQVVIDN